MRNLAYTCRACGDELFHSAYTPQDAADEDGGRLESRLALRPADRAPRDPRESGGGGPKSEEGPLMPAWRDPPIPAFPCDDSGGADATSAQPNEASPAPGRDSPDPDRPSRKTFGIAHIASTAEFLPRRGSWVRISEFALSDANYDEAGILWDKIHSVLICPDFRLRNPKLIFTSPAPTCNMVGSGGDTLGFRDGSSAPPVRYRCRENGPAM